MSKNEIRYDYAKTEYANAINRKNEVRNRASVFFGINSTVLSALATISVTIEQNGLSRIKILLFILSIVFFVLSLVSFAIIYSPSIQPIYSVEDVIDAIREIDELEENIELIEYYDEMEMRDFIISELSYSYAAERMAKISKWYDEKIRKFMFYFIVMVGLQTICLILMIITIAI